jgi:hypothetical protein
MTRIKAPPEMYSMKIEIIMIFYMLNKTIHELAILNKRIE